MKNNAAVRIVLYSILTLVLVGLLVGGLTIRSLPIGVFGSFDREVEGTEVHAGAVPAAGIQELDIEWVDGSIQIIPGDGSEIQFSESGSPKESMVYHVDGDTLEIHFAKKLRFGFTDSITSKDLTVTVPKDWQGREIKVETVNADLEMSDLKVQSVEVEGVSAECNLRNMDTHSLEMETVSGDLTYEGTARRVSMEGVSADMDGTFTAQPEQVDIDGVSGNIRLNLPKDSGFRASVDSASGSFNCNMPVTNQDHIYTYGDGSCAIDVDCMSGDLNIHIAED